MDVREGLPHLKYQVLVARSNTAHSAVPLVWLIEDMKVLKVRAVFKIETNLLEKSTELMFREVFGNKPLLLLTIRSFRGISPWQGHTN